MLSGQHTTNLKQTTNTGAKDQKKRSGSHYTPVDLSMFVAQKIVQALHSNSRPGQGLSILDPAVGDGELIVALIKALSACGVSLLDVICFDINKFALEKAYSRVSSEFPNLQLDFKNEDFVEFSNVVAGGTLFDQPYEPCDVVIANPPYVRTQVMGAGKSQVYSKQLGLDGRVDLYHVFIDGISRILKPDGVAGLIVSNRFMTTKSGATTRSRIARDFDILHIWDLGDTKLFDAAVLPAVLLLKKKGKSRHPVVTAFTSVYSISECVHVAHRDTVVAALDDVGIVKVGENRFFNIHHGTLHQSKEKSAVWRITNQNTDKWLATVEAHTFKTFDEIGAIRVGVKTTADKVFIRTGWKDLPSEDQPELLRDLITHHISRRYKAYESSTSILYPHTKAGGVRKPVDLSEYPKTARYLLKYRQQLESRNYLIEGGRKWYEIWVPHDPDIWFQPKVVFRDITEHPVFWLDTSGAVVNGDCYWLAANNQQDNELLWLILAVGNSTFIEAYYDKRFHNKLYAGRRRFMTQYVKEFPIPQPHIAESQLIIQRAKEIYSKGMESDTQQLERSVDELVWKAFGLNTEEV